MLRSLMLATLLSLSACGAAQPPVVSLADAAISDSRAIVARCDQDAAACGAPDAAYIPVPDGDGVVVWTPSNDRYANEPTLIRATDGTWHVFANSASGVGNPWTELQIIHATAPSLLGPWTEQPDALSTSDPGANERMMWAPFVMRDGNEYVLSYWAQDLAGGGGQRVARSTDLFHWRRTPDVLPGGRDAMVLRLDDGRDLIYSAWTVDRADGVHDAVSLSIGHALTAWSPLDAAIVNPAVCPDSCWGFYESPYVFPFGGDFYLFVTYTVSDASTYERTVVFRSSDPTRFENPPVAQLQAHGGEVHVEAGRMYLTRGGWTNYIGADRRGLSVLPIAFRPVAQ